MAESSPRQFFDRAVTEGLPFSEAALKAGVPLSEAVEWFLDEDYQEVLAAQDLVDRQLARESFQDAISVLREVAFDSFDQGQRRLAAAKLADIYLKTKALGKRKAEGKDAPGGAEGPAESWDFSNPNAS